MQDVAAATLIARVGERVRAAREAAGIPRRVLSERSGVSPRYLAQLESGAGNVSIGLLCRVAAALDRRIEWFISDDIAGDDRASHVAALFRAASRDVQETVLRSLSPPVSAGRAHRICLIGLRGAGKSTLGAQAGLALGLPFVELNDEIEAQSGMPVEEVMALYGQEGYRKLETQAVHRVIDQNDRLILAVAGGIVAEPDTYDLLLDNFHTIWIKTSPNEHMARVRAQGDERPMAGNPEAMEQLKSILTSREALYRRAQAQLDTSGQPVKASLTQLLTMIKTNGFLG